ncbi:MAG: glycosyltransferase family 2 protein [Clostridia bacterium]|nr:glycosyltransferase family 2 protein [Clostridia bacterium]
MDKLITFTIPSYNSAAFMHNCIDSILGAGDDIEILIVNDGSKDDTGAVADSYKEKYPDIVSVIQQENGGHGEGVNQGIRNAKGKYLKIVDSDDRLDPDELKRVLDVIRQNEAQGIDVEMYLCNYVYVRVDTGDRRPMSYGGIFPEGCVFCWEDTKAFGPSKYLMMHSVIYKVELLRSCGLEMPKHTFYVDNLYMYQPLPFVERMYYINSDLYLYYVGNEEQSVNEKNVLKRIDQHILVTRLIIDSHDLNKVKLRSRKLYRYMLHNLSMLITICNVFLDIKGDRESVEKQKELWRYLKEKDIRAYKKLRYASLSALTNFPGDMGRKATVGIYRIVNKIYKPN